MFLTGFDAPALNTLWLDKKLYKHNLIQAFSRTNRISGERKSHGNIICFRTDEETVTDALKKYAGVIDFDAILALTFDQLLNGYAKNGVWHPGYMQLYKDLKQFQDPKTGEIVIPRGEKKRFKELFNKLIRSESSLVQYDEFHDDFEGKEELDRGYIDRARIKFIDLIEEQEQDSKKRRKRKDFVESEGDLTFIKHTEVTLEYIITLIIEYEWDLKNPTKEEIEKFKELLNKKIDASFSLRIKKQLINDFIDSDLPKNRDSFRSYIEEKRNAELLQIIREEGLNEEKTEDFANRKFRDNNCNIRGENTNEFIPITRTEYEKSKEKERRALSKLETFWRKFQGFITTYI